MGFHIQISAQALTITDPPMYWVTAFVAILALVSLLVALGSIQARRKNLAYVDGKVIRTTTQPGVSRRLTVLTFLLFLIAAAATWFSAQSTVLRLDRSSGNYTIDSGYGPLGRSIQSGSLTDIDHATLESTEGAERFTLVLQDGQRESLGSYTDQSNQDKAVAAVNHFLGRNSSDD